MIFELAALFALLGLMLGSFANVCVHRIPRGQSIAFPASHCPHCQHEIAMYDNIPLLSWLLLKAKCRHCKAAIAWRYPMMELIMGISWAGLAMHYGLRPELLVAISLFFLLWVLSVIDLETFLLPNALTYPGIVIGLLSSYWLGGIQGGLDALIGVVAGYAIFWLVARLFLLLTGREGMGYGDFKLLAMLGAFMGWQALPFIILASSAVGTIAGLVFIVLARRGMRTEIPFGPYLAMAGMIWFVWGSSILDWYLQFAGFQR
ncbi:MAG: prepilin peptidase [Mariprofundus sp.]|nr:prepilin peptidase [Mariprofundus sp.]